MSDVYGPTPATRADVNTAWLHAEAAVDVAVASPGDEEALADAVAVFGSFVAASRSHDRAEMDPEAGQ
jgi:hypothetical protein